MLRKIISIKNVGRFLNYSASGDVELRRYSLFFAENGRGKTTLCAILRSLQSGDPAHVIGRATLGSPDAPEIRILLDGGTANFTKGAWTATVPQLAIFDSLFVSENVYSGDAVELDHRRNLYGVIVGKQGRDMALKIDELDAASRAKSAEIRERTAPVEVLVPQGFTIEAFLGLPEDPDIGAKIAAEERELDAVRQADQVKSHAALAELVLPVLPAGFEALLRKTLEGVAEDAERRVTQQIRTHAMHEQGRTWLSEGVGYIRNNACPFCGQALQGLPLIAAYRAYFSEAYAALRREIASLRQQVETALGDRTIAAVERTMDQNAAALEFWTRYCELRVPAMAGGAGEALRVLRQATLALLDRKAAAPLDLVTPAAAFTGAQAAVAAVQAAATAYNEAVRAANTTIAAKKATTQAADIKAVDAALSRLRAVKKRHEPDGRKACEEYQVAIAEKNTIEGQKAAVKQQLDDYTRQVIGRYEKTINRLLDDFDAGFRITGTTHGYPGGVASSSYQILINETAVDLGDADTPLDKPSFRNTVSSGDKSTLALAFFLAQLEHDAEKAVKIVVFDDPFNSQDGFRKDCTVQKIKKCGDTCARVIVLSHDQSFLERLWTRLEAADRKCLKMARVGLRNTTIFEWDIEEATQALYKAQRKVLTDYHHTGEGDPRDVVQKIRPVLETYCKLLGAGALAAADTLGRIIEKLGAAGPGHQLFAICDALEELNDYTKRYMHGENPHAATELISEEELNGYVKRTLDVTGGC